MERHTLGLPFSKLFEFIALSWQFLSPEILS
jgi:hypothetical protein